MRETDCNVIRDILPLYQDNVVSADTAEPVREHLKRCPGCARELERMRAPASVPPEPDGELWKNFARRRERKRKKKRCILVCAGAVLIAAIAFCLWYARPMTLGQLCPGLELSGEWAVAAAYTVRDTHPDGKVDTCLHGLALQMGDPAAPELLHILNMQTYRRSLLSLLPRLNTQSVTITNRSYWRVQMADGRSSFALDTATGRVELRFSGAGGSEVELYCAVDGQEAFERIVYEWLVKNGAEND